MPGRTRSAVAAAREARSEYAVRMAVNAMVGGPPGQRAGHSTGMRDRPPDAALVITHTPSGDGRGRRIDIPARGVVLGGNGSDIEVDGAEGSGSRVEIRWHGAESDETGAWQAQASGRVTFNREPATRRALRTFDDFRVVDTFFRFLCGRELEHEYHETIYHLTIRDMTTGLANPRYLQEVMDKEISRALTLGERLAVAVMQFTSEVDAGGSPLSELLCETAARVGDGLPRGWFGARGGEWELVVIAPETAQRELEQRARVWLRECARDNAATRLGTAELDSSIRDATTLMKAARTNATRLDANE